MSSKSSARSVVRIPKQKAIKEKILGKDYELSLVFCKDTLSRKLNRIYRGKDKPTNILSFPLSKNSGEIFINTDRLDGFSPTYLFIHGLLHLKGMQHGVKMDNEEKRFLKLFNGKKEHLSRHRYRKSKR